MKKLLVLLVLACSQIVTCCHLPNTDDGGENCENPPLIIAHRGYWNREGGKQNDLESYKAAIEAGFAGAETDVRQTKDGVLVLSHDDIYEQKVISQSNYIDLDGITTLEDLLYLLKTTSNFKLLIEIKNADCVEIIRLIDQVGINYLQLVFISFYHVYCEQLIGMQRNLNVAYLTGDLSPYELSDLGYNGIAYEYPKYLNNITVIKEAKEMGLAIYTWTVNNIEIMYQSINIGCGYIITDKPDMLNEYCCR